jgi:MFS family permease
MNSSSKTAGPWSPLTSPTFRALWIATVVSNLGTWMQTVGSQWLVIDEPNAATWVALIQTAMTLPIALFAFPAGIFADSHDRRRMLIVMQIFQITVSTTLAVWVIHGGIPPIALVLLTFALGFGQSLTHTPYASSINELVPRHQLPMAAALGGVSTNIGRAIGPALAGFAIALYGTGLVFILNALSFVWFLIALLNWKRDATAPRAPKTTFREASAQTWQFVKSSRQMQNLMIRVSWFAIPAQAIWAMLPIFANKQLGADSGEYGVLLAMLGLGSVVAAATIPGFRRMLGSNRLIGWGFFAYAIVTVAMIPTTSFAFSILLMLAAGFGWIAVLSGLSGPVQLHLPENLRARGLASYLVVQFGCNAAGAFLWGQVTQHSSLSTSLAFAAALMLAGVGLTHWRPIHDDDLVDEPTANSTGF